MRETRRVEDEAALILDFMGMQKLVHVLGSLGVLVSAGDWILRKLRIITYVQTWLVLKGGERA